MERGKKWGTCMALTTPAPPLGRMLSLFGDREARILVLGLDNAGKTTILCRLQRAPATASPSDRQSDSPPMCLLQTACKLGRWFRRSQVGRGRVLGTDGALALCMHLHGAGLASTCMGAGLSDHLVPMSALLLAAIGFNVETVTYKNIKVRCAA